MLESILPGERIIFGPLSKVGNANTSDYYVRRNSVPEILSTSRPRVGDLVALHGSKAVELTRCAFHEAETLSRPKPAWHHAIWLDSKNGGDEEAY